MKHFLCKCFGLYVFLIIQVSATAQIHNSFFNNYTISDGLTDNIIHCIFQDSRGWIWAGTSFGVIRFDGYKFEKFDLDNTESKILGKSLVRAIFEDRNGIIWIASESQGVFVYDRSKNSLEQIKGKGSLSGLSNNSIWDIVEDEQGIIWIATENGLDAYDPQTKKFQVFHHHAGQKGSLSDNYTRKLLIDNKGVLWVGTDVGLDRYDAVSGTFHHFRKRVIKDERENQVWEIFQDRNRRIWIGTYLGGLKYLDPATSRLVDVSFDTKNERATTVRAIVEDKEGDLWVGTRGGLFTLNKNYKVIAHYEHDDLDDFSLTHNSVLELFIDRKSDLWVGTRDGISYLNFDKQAFGNISAEQEEGKGLKNSEVYALWEDKNDRIWIGTESGGVNIYDKNTRKITYLTRDNGLTNNCIKAILPDNNGNVLIGNFLGGLNQYNIKTGKVRHYLNDPNDNTSISSNSVWAITRDHSGRIWVGTDLGIDEFDPETGKFTHFGQKFNATLVVMIYADSQGRLWMFSDNNTLIMVDKQGNVSDYPYKCRSMCEDDKNDLWLATLGSGLVKFNPEKDSAVYYTTDEGLCSNVIYGVINTGDGFLWLSTKNGLSRFNVSKGEFRNYYRSDGLSNDQFCYGAYLNCGDGKLIFGGRKGVDIVYLERLKENDYLPPTVITDFRIFNKSVPIMTAGDENAVLTNLPCETKKIMLNYDQSVITFEYAALNYANSQKNRYKYKLEGFDKDWNNVGTQRRATYTNLAPGDYTFKVKGSNNDGKFNKKATSVELIILPPFWKTWWFRLIVVMFIAILGYLIFVFIANREKLKNQLIIERHSARKVHELDMLKHQFFMNISHEIRTPLSLILGPLDKLIQTEMKREVSLSHLSIIKRNAQNLNKLVNQLLDYRKLETGNVRLDMKKGNISDFIREIVKSFQDFAGEKNINLQFKSVHHGIFTWFDPDKIEKVVNNLLSNALKYTSDGGTVSVLLSMIFADDIQDVENIFSDNERQQLEHKQYIQVVVRDTGIGIPASQLNKIFNRFQQIHRSKTDRQASGTGIGLSLTKELVKIHKGFIHVRSIEGKGSKFTLLLPFIEEYHEQEKEKTDEHKTGENLQLIQPEIYRVADQSIVKHGADNQPILLMVDDNPDIRSFVKYHFEPEYIVLEARNGREGWEMALESVPDILVADIMMPEMDGNDLCRKIKKDERTSHIPVIMLTALSAREKQMAGIDAGADDYITKPFDITLLKARIDNTLSIRKALRERYSKEFVLKPREIVLTSPDEKFLKRIIGVIEKNIANTELDIDKLALQVGVSRTQLYRKIAALTDMTAKEFVRDIRLKRAAQMLLQNKLTIQEIALEVGFSDISYFRKCFREKFGMSASEYNKNNSMHVG